MDNIVEVLKFKYPEHDFAFNHDTETLIDAPKGFSMPSKRDLQKYAKELEEFKVKKLDEKLGRLNLTKVDLEDLKSLLDM